MTTTPGKRVTIWIGERAKHHHEPLYLAILNQLFAAGVPAAKASKAVAGFGADHRMRTARILEMSEDLPMHVTFVAPAAQADTVLAALLPLLGSAVVDVQETTLVTP